MITSLIHDLSNPFIIGVAKWGTTSLHHYSNLHPKIAMAQERI